MVFLAAAVAAWLLVGFVARCLFKYDFTHRFPDQKWTWADECAGDFVIIGGPISILVIVFVIFAFGKACGTYTTARKYYWGLKF